MDEDTMRKALAWFSLILSVIAVVVCFWPGPCKADDQWHLAVGLGLHDPALDWHVPPSDVPAGESKNDGYLSNPLGIVKLHYQSGRWDAGVEHISSIPNTHDNWGVTMAYVTVDIW